MGFRDPTPDELAELNGTPAPRLRDPTPAELAELGPPPARPSEMNARPTAADLALAEPGDEPPAARGTPGLPRTPEGVPAMRDPKAPGAGETALLHGTQGLTGGFADELAATVARIPIGTGTVGPMGMPAPIISPEDAYAGAHPPTPEEYRADRDLARSSLEDMRKENPKTALAAEVAGSALSPINQLGPANVKGASALSNIARGGARTGIQGGVFGAGNSNADLTTLDPAEVQKFARDVGIGTVVGAGVGAAGETAAAGVRAASRAVLGSLPRRILNEVAEGPLGATTAIERRRLEKAEGAIVSEVLTEPDAKAVRAAFNSTGTEGRAALRPIVNAVGDKLDAGYTALEQAGRGKPDLPAYLAALQSAADEARQHGKALLAKGLEGQKQAVREFVNDAGGSIDLRQLRGLTTETQQAAAGALGGLHDQSLATQLKKQISAVATDAMSDALDRAASNDPALRSVVSDITANNRRMYALLTIDSALERRAAKEATAPGLAVRAAKALGGSTAGAVAGSAYSGDDDRMRNAMLGAALGAGALPAFRAVGRGVTTAAIAGARGELPRLAATEAAAGIAARAGARAAASPQRPTDDAVVQLFRMAKAGGNEAAVMKKAAELGIDPASAEAIIRAMSVSREPVGTR